MVLDVRRRLSRSDSTRARARVALAALGGAVAIAGCGSSAKHAAGAEASADPPGGASCPATALTALGHVAMHVYHEGISSERAISALRAIEGSAPLRLAVEAGDPAGVRGAAQALVATGEMAALRVSVAGKVLADVGEPAVAPLSGALTGAAGKPIASFVTSVWSDRGLTAETGGITEGTAVLRTTESAGGRTLAGRIQLPTRHLAARGTLTHDGTTYQFTSNAVGAFPSGRLREYVLRPIGSLTPFCGASAEETTVNVLSRIAHLIYDGETGGRTVPQIRRVQRNQALLSAVARRDPTATRAAVAALLTQHIVRLRVSDAGEKLLSDVGGPFVLAPVHAPLRLAGRTIGSLVLSIQDDEGYKRLAGRLAGLDVVMYMGSRLVKSTISFSPGTVPTSGPFSYRGRRYRDYTFYADAFPSGPLRITVLVPIPYS